MKINLSVIILTKNEENNIVDCIETVNFADEIIVIDDFSEDRTVELIENLKNRKIRIIQHRLNDDFSSQRNFSQEIAEGEWLLFIDADERLSRALQGEINYLIWTDIHRQKFNGYFIKRRDVIWGKELKYGETGNIKLLHLARRGVGKWEGKVHEVWKVKGKIGVLKNPLTHYPHQDMTEFLKEINFYTDLRAQELYKQKKKMYWLLIIAYPLGKFLLNFILRRGFLDGIHGFVFAIMMILHSFLARGKLWLLWNEGKRPSLIVKEARSSGAKFAFLIWAVFILYQYVSYLLCKGGICLRLPL